MDEPRLSLNVLEVPSPCRVPWKSMAGSDRVRFCNRCQEDVYNLSMMTAAEAQAILAGPNTPCVRFYRRHDGTVVTTDRCGQPVVRAWQILAGIVSATLVGLASLAGGDGPKLGFCTQGKPAPPVRTGNAATAVTTTQTATDAAADPKGGWSQ